MPETQYRGQFLWHELMTSDTRSAAVFYGRVFGWGTEKWSQDPSYTMFTNRGAPIAGFMPIPAEAKATGTPPSWMAYIGTRDVHVTAWEAQRLGGRLLKEPTKTPSVGTWAVLQDPQGAVFAAYTPENARPPAWPPKAGEFSWHELATSDAAAAFNFYHELFGWEKTGAFDMGVMGMYHTYGWGKRTLGGIYKKPHEMAAPPHWLSYTRVADSKKTADLIKQAGGKVLHGPAPVPGGDWIVMAADPQGAAFAAHSLAAKKRKATARKKTAKKTAKKQGGTEKKSKKANRK